MPITLDGDGSVSGIGDLNGYDLETNTLVVTSDTTIAAQAPNRASLFVDESSNTVGINTTVPNAAVFLQVADATDPLASFLNTGGNEVRVGCSTSVGHIGTTGVTPFEIRTNNTSRLFIAGGGAIGIGTSTPSQALDVQGSLRISNGSPSPALVLEDTDASGTCQIAQFNSGDFVFNQNAAGRLIRFVTPTSTEALIIDGNGNVGINESNPVVPFEIGVGIDNSRRAILARGADTNFALCAIQKSTGNSSGQPVAQLGVRYQTNDADSCGITFLRGAGTDDGMLQFYNNDKICLFNNTVGNWGIGIDGDTAALNGIKLRINEDNGQEDPIQLAVTSNLTSANLRLGAGASTNTIPVFADCSVLEGRDGDLCIGTGSSGTSIRFYRSSGRVEAMRIDSNGRLLLRSEIARTNYTFGTASVNPNLQNENTSATASIGIIRNSNDTNGSCIYLAKTRGSQNGVSVNPLQAGDRMGSVAFNGGNGADIQNAARIEALADDDFTGTETPARINFLTTPAGSLSPTNRMTLNNQGYLGVGTTSPGTLLSVGIPSSNPDGEKRIWLGSINNDARYARTAEISKDTTDLALRISAGRVDNPSCRIIFRGSRPEVEDARYVCINNSGNMGYGTESPDDTLDLARAGGGIILTSANGTRYRMTVSNAGDLDVAAV